MAWRRFILRLIPEISFCAGIFSQVYKKTIQDQEIPQIVLLDVEMLSLLIKNGFNNVQKFALNSILKSSNEVSRMSTSKIYASITPYLNDSEYSNDFNTIYRSVEVSYLSYLNEPF